MDFHGLSRILKERRQKIFPSEGRHFHADTFDIRKKLILILARFIRSRWNIQSKSDIKYTLQVSHTALKFRHKVERFT